MEAISKIQIIYSPVYEGKYDVEAELKKCNSFKKYIDSVYDDFINTQKLVISSCEIDRQLQAINIQFARGYYVDMTD